jgi:hypothetical protein
LVCAGAFAGLALAVPGVAAAKSKTPPPPPPCGTTLYASVTLTANLYCSGTDGYDIGTDGITVNLNGFSIIGNYSGYTGIYNDGQNNVTVENGTIQGFGTGVELDSTGHNNVTNVTTTSNSGDGVEVYSSNNATLSGVHSTYNGSDGFDMSYNHNLKLMNSTANHNGAEGVDDYFSFATLSGDKANHNSYDGFYVDYPIRFVNSKGVTQFYTYSGDTANHNGGDGFDISDNAPSSQYQARVMNSIAHYNSDWGFWAEANVANGSTGNKGLGNASGNCYHVPCTTG